MDEKLVLSSVMKQLLLLIILFKSNIMYTQKIEDVFHKKWMIIKTTNNTKLGWNAYIDNYILDFSDKKCLVIKTLGDKDLINLEYELDINKGVISEKNGDVLYRIKELSSKKLLLYMGIDNNTVTAFFPLTISNEIKIDELSVLLKNGKWISGNNIIQFTDEMYMVVDEIETIYNVFIEYDKDGKKYKGAWLIDCYKDFILLELFSERYSYKGIYQITNINNSFLEAETINENGDKLEIKFKND